MITHVVMFTWKDGVTPEQVDKVTAALHALRGSIPGMTSMAGAPDLRLRPGNPDYLLIATFKDEAAWRGYQAHPLHKALLVDLIEPMAAQRHAMQAAG